ncbi:FtsX-like permease family protein [Aeromicrobium sp. UC242_57]|uniref:FtsX-like permease family protein n=1 Tax=Aeromicrobium sp. UC242_57 TaxID=3374624 RepID=UPI00379209E2
MAGGLPDRADILKTLDVVLAVTVGLLAIAVLIALVGVGNTLSLSVLERVRENSLLRALGLSRSGLRAMLAIEALLISVVAAVLGVVLGTTYAWFGVKTTAVGVFATSPDILMPGADRADPAGRRGGWACRLCAACPSGCPDRPGSRSGRRLGAPRVVQTAPRVVQTAPRVVRVGQTRRLKTSAAHHSRFRG